MKTSLKLLALLLLFVFSCQDKEDNDQTLNTDIVYKDIPQAGGQITLPNVAAATFESGAFNETVRVSIARTRSIETANDFNFVKALYGITQSTDYEIRINTGNTKPSSYVTVSVNVPIALIASLQSEVNPQVFGQLYFSEDGEQLDNFEPIESNYLQGKLELQLPYYFFTNTRNTNGTYEAILKLAACPGYNLNTERSLDLSTCSAPKIGCPLSDCSDSAVTSPFGLRVHPVTGEEQSFHYGTDFRAATGTPVHSATDGVVSQKGYQMKGAKGWGYYVIVEYKANADNKSHRFSTVYAHLSQINVTEGQNISEGQVIGLSGQSGGVDGPHLHLEYFTNFGQIKKFDPKANIDSVLPRLYSAAAKTNGVNNCPHNNNTIGTSWSVKFKYKDMANSITPNSTITFQDIAPIVNPPYTVNIGTLISAQGEVNSPVFCARFGSVNEFKIKSYITLPNGMQSNCMIFRLKKPTGANRTMGRSSDANTRPTSALVLPGERLP